MSRSLSWMVVIALILGSTSCRQRASLDTEEDTSTGEVPTLIEALADSDSDVRFAATLELGRLGEKSTPAVPALIKALKDRDALVRGSAADALGRIGDKEGVSPLIESLKDPAPEVRAAAVRALEKFQAKKAVPALLGLAREDRDEEVRSQARRVVWEVDPARARQAGLRAE